MCGIAGVLGDIGSWNILNMLSKVTHRGPDDLGVSLHGDYHIGMVRLAIIDIENGRQPFKSKCGNYEIVFNGEIFNHIKLRKKLETDFEVIFSTRSDTETLLYGLIHLGMAFLNEVDGMYSFCFIDKVEKLAHISIDKFGIKSCYYKLEKDRLIFCSEARFEKMGALNIRAVNEFLNFGFTNKLSIYSDVERVSPGSVLQYCLKTKKLISEKKLFQVSKSKRHSSNNYEKFNPSVLRNSIIESVELWTESDVDISLSLSGGIDSTIIALCLAELGKTKATQAITVASEGSKNNEVAIACNTARHFGFEIEKVLVTYLDYVEEFPKIVKAIEEPYFGSVISWWVYKNCKSKVLLTGSGADEIFGNYNKRVYKEDLIRQLRNKFNGYLNNQCHGLGSEIYYYRPLYPDTKFLNNKLISPNSVDEFYNTKKFNDWQEFISSFDLEFQLPWEFLFMTDRFSMAHGVEARTPFLGKIITDHISTLDPKMVERNKPYKASLLEAFPEVKKLIPQKKSGFTDNDIWFQSFIKENYKAIERQETDSQVMSFLNDASKKKFSADPVKFMLVNTTFPMLHLWYSTNQAWDKA